MSDFEGLLEGHGAPVNLASRVTEPAPPGTVAPEPSVVSATSANFAWEPLGARRLKGIPQPVELHVLEVGTTPPRLTS